jgi:hypothetical protein
MKTKKNKNSYQSAMERMQKAAMAGVMRMEKEYQTVQKNTIPPWVVVDGKVEKNS